MGYATIAAELGDGRYVIDLDFGEAQRVALIATINAAITTIDDKLAALQPKIDAADAAEAAQQVKIDAAFAAIAAAGNNLPPGSPVPDTTLYKAEQATLRKLRFANEPLRINKKTLQRSKDNLIIKRTQYATLICTEQRSAWCCDLTKGATGIVATVDIPGESDLILIAPGAPAWNPTDGQFRERELLSPEQCFYNAAVLPTWQKYKPTYRWGTITFKNDDLNIVNVTLGPASSSAVGINVNQTPQLNGIPVEYLFCNSRAFEVGDNVVIRFGAPGFPQDWAFPTVIGFLDNPRQCNGWNYEGATRFGTGNGGINYYFSTTSTALVNLMVGGALTEEARINGGPWIANTGGSAFFQSNPGGNPNPYRIATYDFDNLGVQLVYSSFSEGHVPLQAIAGAGVNEPSGAGYIRVQPRELEPMYTSGGASSVFELRFKYGTDVILNFSVRPYQLAASVIPAVRCLGTYNAAGWSPEPYETINTPLFLEE